MPPKKKFHIRELEQFDESDWENIFEGITDEQAENSDMGGDEEALKIGEFDSVMDGSVSVTKWMDRGTKSVVMAYNMHSPAEMENVQRTNKRGVKKSIVCPKIISDYNKYMGGVDRFDQLMSSYAVAWKSRRWWMKIFYYLLDAAIVNSYIIYKDTNTNCSRFSRPFSYKKYTS